MKEGIHPTYNEVEARCACGNTWQTMSTKEVLKTDLCSNCHPYYTGEQRIVDTAGQVERFMRRMGARTEQAARPVAPIKRGSKNKANVPPPPQERRPTPGEADAEAEAQEGGEVAVATAEPGTAEA